MTRLEKIDFVITNIKGIGQVRAEKIVDAFPDVDVFLHIVNLPNVRERLNKVVSISLTNSILQQLEEIVKQDEIISLMTNCGLSYYASIQLAKNKKQLEAFKKDPYTIGQNCNLSFKACDKFAHIYFGDNCPDMTIPRMSWFIDTMLAELEDSGHTFAYLKQLVKKINQYQYKNQYLPEDYTAASIMLYIVDNDFFEIEKNTENIDMWKIYRKQTAKLESDIAFHIKRLASNKTISNTHFDNSKSIKYDFVQLSAINSASKSGLKIITGPPGSGKTAVINGIIQYFRQIKPSASIILCAPTGRAAKHITEITGEHSSTIHRLLGLRQDFDFIKKQPLECDMLVCDEASMLSLDITYQLLSHIKTGTVVYFVGDKDQLPAVGPGNVLHDIINSKKVPTFHLSKVYRQDGIILENAHLINNGVVPTKTNNRYTVETFNDEDALKQKTVEIFKKKYDPKNPFETQILIPSYKTNCGIMAINNEIQKLNPENFIYKSRSGYSYKKNDKILMIKNDPAGLYQNGSVGIFIANEGDELRVDFDGEEVLLPKSAINDMTLGYAISVHKAQGSEYTHVIMCLPNKPKNMLKRNILYTGVTRAKKDIVILEMEGTVKQSVENNVETFTQTGLKEKIVSL